MKQPPIKKGPRPMWPRECKEAADRLSRIDELVSIQAGVPATPLELPQSGISVSAQDAGKVFRDYANQILAKVPQ